MLIAVVGGKLQGVEAVYLIQKAGWQSLVIDKNPDAPATGLCDRFLAFEFTTDSPVPPGCPDVDLILPAIEDMDVLTAVAEWAGIKRIPLAFDLDAYQISCSKLTSNALFNRMNLPVPGSWPHCGFPIVVKPDQASGSQGVEVIRDAISFDSRFPGRGEKNHLVIQEYVEGPCFSIEVIGRPGLYEALQVTDLFMDTSHDCKRVTAPTQLAPRLIRRFEEMAVAIAQQIRLTGIMDVEAVLNQDRFNLLEIDARFPSQTPVTVFWSRGINMVERLCGLVSGRTTAVNDIDKGPGTPEGQDKQRARDKHAARDKQGNKDRFVRVEHIRVSGSELAVAGEHIMTLDGPLRLVPGFFGCDEAITSYTPKKSDWVATMIFAGSSEKQVAERRRKCYDRIRNQPLP